MELALGLSAWIIQDGNYGDFRRDQRIEVAVEFGFAAAPSHSNAPLGIVLTDGSNYEITGRVVFATADVWVLDVGILVFNEAAPPPGVSVGDVVSGVGYVGVDPFFYFERLAERAEMPPLIYSWTITGISMQTAPFIEQGRVRFRDPSKAGWREVSETNAWTDDGGHAEYVLRCELLDVPPKRTSATAT